MRGTLADLGESGLLEVIRRRFSRQRHPSLLLGPGDDAALARLEPGKVLVATQDDLAEGTHFELRWTDFRRLAHKLVRINLSDLAAMGAVAPLGVIVSAGFPARAPARWAGEFLRGLSEDCRRFRVAVLGGNLARSRNVFFSLTALGQASKGLLLRRSGARNGDLIAGLGPLGAASEGLKALKRGTRSRAAVRAFWEPEPQFRAAEILARKNLAAALMDNSDGLGRSCEILAGEASLGFELDLSEAPVEGDPHAGEDYGLVFSVRPGKWAALKRALPGAYRLGRFTARRPLRERRTSALRGRRALARRASAREGRGFDQFRGR